MEALTPYLFFNGNCREVMNFYKQCFGGELEIFTYGDAPPQACDMSAAKDQIMHASLKQGAFALMASDWPNKGAQEGNNIQLSIVCSTKSETDSLFKVLSEGGKVVQPLADTFWGSYFGMFVDKFGVHWMINCPLNQ